METNEQKVTRLLDEIIIQIENINSSLKKLLEGKNETDKERKPV